ncbi:MAG: type II toxin-antitoxin system RelE/ParE family toxin [Cyanobacteria bacterium P01_A01_bin.123]
MKVRFRSSFKKDLKRLKDPNLLFQISTVIEQRKASESLPQVSNVSKLKGYDDFYRIRIGNFRVGIKMMGDEIILVRFLHRKKIYRFFP